MDSNNADENDRRDSDTVSTSETVWNSDQPVLTVIVLMGYTGRWVGDAGNRPVERLLSASVGGFQNGNLKRHRLSQANRAGCSAELPRHPTGAGSQPGRFRSYGSVDQ